MPQLVPLVGSLVGGDVYEYASFTDNSGRPVDGGTSFSVWLGTSLDDELTKVKCNRDQLEAFLALGFGTDVRVLATPFAKGRRIEYRCESFEQVESASAR